CEVSLFIYFFFSSRRRHTRFSRDWSSDVCSSDLLYKELSCQNTSRIVRDILSNLNLYLERLHRGRSILVLIFHKQLLTHIVWQRSEERRVGKECRSRCVEYH